MIFLAGQTMICKPLVSRIFEHQSYLLILSRLELVLDNLSTPRAPISHYSHLRQIPSHSDCLSQNACLNSKQGRPWSDCFFRSSLIWIWAVCLGIFWKPLVFGISEHLPYLLILSRLELVLDNLSTPQDPIIHYSHSRRTPYHCDSLLWTCCLPSSWYQEPA